MTGPRLQTRLMLACLTALLLFALLLSAWLIATALSQDDGEGFQLLARSTQAAATALAEAGSPDDEAQRRRFFERLRVHVGSQLPEPFEAVMAVTRGSSAPWTSDGWPAGLAVPPQDGPFERHHDGRTWFGHRASAGPITMVQMIDLTQTRASLSRQVIGEVLVYVALGSCAVSAALVVALRRGLRPLRHLVRDLARRAPGDARPFVLSPAFRELEPLVRALNDARQREAEARERERRLIQESAHALSTPLMALEGQAAALQRHAAPGDERLQRLERTAARANRLARQMLKLAILDSDERPAPQDFDLMDLLREALAEIEDAARRSGTPVQLEGPDQLALHADALTLRCLLDNLLSNAVRHGPGGLGLRVTVSDASGGVCIRVLDHGPGIPPELRESLFEPFRRGPSNGQDGAGLGLAIVRKAASQLDARVSLGVGPGGTGCLVELILPHAARRGPSAQAVPAYDAAWPPTPPT